MYTYAIREKGTQKYLPAMKNGRIRMRGFSNTDPVEGVPPRLFPTKRSAENALIAWLQGSWEMHQTRSGWYGEGVDIYPEPTPVRERMREKMEIVVFVLNEI
jgi:hypothetical protein